MGYVICKEVDGEIYFAISSGGGTNFTKKIKDAMIWKKKQSADNVLEKMPKAALNPTIRVELISEDKIASKNTEVETGFLEKVNEMYNFIKRLEDRRIDLKSEIATIDLEIVDIEHYVEFNEFNAAKGYKAYKMLHDTRKRRRELKDELEKIELILGTSLKSKNLDNLDKSIKGLDTRKYTPRVRKELFD